MLILLLQNWDSNFWDVEGAAAEIWKREEGGGRREERGRGRGLGLG